MAGLKFIRCDRIYDEIGSSYLFDLDFDESLDSQQDSPNPETPMLFSVDARYMGNVSHHLQYSNSS